MLILKDLTKKFGHFTAVDNLNLTIGKGEFFGLLGPNGAGKTTTIRMISTLASKSSGSIAIDGVEIGRNSVAVKRKIGVVSQYLNLEREMTGRENLEIHGYLYKMPKEKRKRRINELLDYVGLLDRADDLIKDYSGGMKRKLMIARALMHEPEVLLLDEPTVGLDPAVRRKIWDLMKNLNKDGMTVILTTHYIEEAEALCNRVGMMYKGKLVELDEPKKLIQKVGNFVVDYFEDEETKYEFFNSRKDAIEFAAGLNGSVNIRPSNLEDVFIKLTNKRMEG